eukprot:gene9652-biopygen198
MPRGGCSRPESSWNQSRHVHTRSSISDNLDSQGNLKTQGYRELNGAYSERLDSHSEESSLAPHEYNPPPQPLHPSWRKMAKVL